MDLPGQQAGAALLRDQWLRRPRIDRRSRERGARARRPLPLGAEHLSRDLTATDRVGRCRRGTRLWAPTLRRREIDGAGPASSCGTLPPRWRSFAAIVGWQRIRAWVLFSSALTTNSSSCSGRPSHSPAYRSRTRAALAPKSGSRGKIQLRWVANRPRRSPHGRFRGEALPGLWCHHQQRG